jgi:hypothetical protein
MADTATVKLARINSDFLNIASAVRLIIMRTEYIGMELLSNSVDQRNKVPWNFGITFIEWISE